MVALNEQFHHNGTTAPPAGVTGYGLQRSGESGVDFIDQRSLITDQKRRTSNDLFIDHYSLVIERSACANEIIYGGYPDNNRVSTDNGAGLDDPGTELYYVRNRTYGSIPGTVLRQEPKSRQATGVATRVLQRDPVGYVAGSNLYEYGGVNPAATTDPYGEIAGACGWLTVNATGNVTHISQGWLCFGQVTLAKSQAQLNRTLSKQFPISKSSGCASPCTCHTLLTIGPYLVGPITSQQSGSKGPCSYTVTYTITLSIWIGVGVCE